MLVRALFRSRRFIGANLLTLFLYSTLNGVLFFFPLNLIQGLAVTPLQNKNSLYLPQVDSWGLRHAGLLRLSMEMMSGRADSHPARRKVEFAKQNRHERKELTPEDENVGSRRTPPLLCRAKET